jgi:catechol 2,3-dioxygenase-like lactoylglutathione lyase family enzyme
MLFVNIPVADLERSKAFFAKLGFSYNPMFTDETAACMLVGGFMYSRSFSDLDGHGWQVMWMDAAAAEQGPTRSPPPSRTPTPPPDGSKPSLAARVGAQTGDPAAARAQGSTTLAANTSAGYPSLEAVMQDDRPLPGRCSGQS